MQISYHVSKLGWSFEKEEENETVVHGVINISEWESWHHRPTPIPP